MHWENLTNLLTWILGITKFDIFKLMDFAISKNGILKGEKIFKHMEYLFDHANIEDLDIPYAAVAVDIQNLKEIVFKSGELSKAIRASVAIPTILKPSMRKKIENWLMAAC